METEHHYLPGSRIVIPSFRPEKAFDVLDPIFAISPDGLSLSQVAAMTGITTSTVQNWVKRGWLASPVGKKYDSYHIARVLIINLLRDIMLLEDIVSVLEFVNGDVNCKDDDLIAEPELYNLLCSAIWQLEEKSAISLNDVTALASKIVLQHDEVAKVAEKLETALSIMLYGVTAMVFANEGKKLINDKVGKPVS